MKGSYLNDAFFSRLETLALNLRADLAGFFGGKHLVKTHGQTVEFADYREYMLGDDIRRIDWNLYSRFERFYIKLFTDERQMHIRIFLDCSASMGKETPGKGAYAVATAAALGFLAIHNTDKVSFKLMKGNACDDPFGVMFGKQTFFRVVNELEQIRFDDDTDLGSAISGCSEIGTGDGLAVIISDFFTDSDWKKAVDYLLYKKQQVLLVQVLSPEEIEPTYTGRVHLMDAESVDLADPRNMRIRITRGLQQAYDDALNYLKSDIETFCNMRGVDYICVRSDTPIEKMLFGELLKVGIME